MVPIADQLNMCADLERAGQSPCSPGQRCEWQNNTVRCVGCTDLQVPSRPYAIPY